MYSGRLYHGGACKVLKIPDEKPGKILCLFKLSGSLIPDTDGRTIGRFIRQLHISPTKTKIGVGYVPMEVLSWLTMCTSYYR